MANPRWKPHNADDVVKIQEIEPVPTAPAFDSVPPSILEELEAAPDVAVGEGEVIQGLPTTSHYPTYAADVELMNRAAEKMIAFLPPDAQDLVFEYQRSTETPLWQLVLGYLMRCRENAEMFSPNILPEWDQGISPNSPLPCGTCKTIMKPRNYGHSYCCNACASGRLKEVGGHNEDCALMHG